MKYNSILFILTYPERYFNVYLTHRNVLVPLVVEREIYCNDIVCKYRITMKEGCDVAKVTSRVFATIIVPDICFLKQDRERQRAPCGHRARLIENGSSLCC